MKKEEAIKFIKNNPVFWSRLGFCYDPPLKNEQGKPLCFVEDLSVFGNYHRAFRDVGVKIHTCILHLGWVGVDEYDYSLTDRVLEELFRDNPDGYFIPRIKLNVPIDWCKENPEDVFVYHGGPETAEEIKALVGTLKQDYLGYEAPDGYGFCSTAGGFIDKRPNVGGLISRQSFSSKKWLEDASVALEKVLDRIESSKYAERILSYHIGYGGSGETVLWGRMSERYGDYGISHRKNFYDWGIKKYGSKERLAEVWQQPDIDRDNVTLPSPEERYAKTESVESFFRADKTDAISIDFDYFISEANAKAIEHFGKVIKDRYPNKLVGSFYGYFLHVDNAAYTGHLAIDRLLESPYIDFLAAPKAYYRNKAGEPGGVLSSTMSINRRKIWLDELDNRTHLSTGFTTGTSDSFDQTKTVYWREFAKNLADDSGFWWMDLGGGWFDDKQTMDEFAKLVKANDIIRQKEHKSKSDILMVVDDESICHMNISRDLRLGFMEDFLCELHMTGCLTDVYRLSDLPELDLRRYKLIIFAYTFRIDEKTREFIKNIPADKTLMFNYAAGIISENGVSLDNITNLTGAKLEQFENDKYSFPELRIFGTDERIAELKRENGGVNIINTKPFMSRGELRAIAEKAGCHAFAPSGNTVYGDNRFVGVFASEQEEIDINLKEKGDYVNLVTGEEFDNTNKITLEVSKTKPVLLVKKDVN